MLKGCISVRKRPSFRLKPVIFSLLIFLILIWKMYNYLICSMLYVRLDFGLFF